MITRNKLNKKSQETIGLSFSVIFSILLMIFFIIIAFIAINSFLKTKKCAQIGIFLEDFETEVDKVWNSQRNSLEFKGAMPNNLDYVCFADLSQSSTGEHKDIGFEIGVYRGQEANTFFSPRQNACKIPYYNVRHLDIEKITETENPYCVKIEEGIIKMKLDKGFSQRLVGVSRVG